MTKTAKHSLLFKLWIKLRGLLAIIIVLFGIFVGLISLILPNEELYKDYVVEFLSKQWQKQVKIESISGKWRGFGAKFVIDGLTIKDTDEVVVQQATLKLNLLQYIIPGGATGISLGISDIEVDFERKSSGKIVLTDAKDKQESFTNKLEKLLASGSISVQNLTFNLNDSLNNAQHKINSKITLQQSFNKRAFVLELDSKDLANKIVFKAISAKKHDFMQQAKWYIDVDNLSLQQLQLMTNKSYFPNAHVDAQVWVKTQAGNITKMIAQVDFKNKLFKNNAEITGLAKLFYKGSRRNWSANLFIKDIKTASIAQDEINIRLSRHADIIKLQADVLDILLLKSIMQILDIADDEFHKLNLTGKLSKVDIAYDVKLRRMIAADIDFQGLDFFSDFAKINNLSGRIGFHDEQIRLLIDSQNGAAEIPKIMRGKLNWNSLLLTAQTSMQDDYLDIKLNSLWCDCNDFILDGAARVVFDEQLFLDLAFAVYDAKVNQLYKYWPANVWKANVLNFLDTALVRGVVKNGMIIYHGFKHEAPFDGKQGVFLTHSNLQSATVKYHKDWPVLSRFNAAVTTKNNKLVVQSTRGNVLNARINYVKAIINNFKKPLLTVVANATGKDNFLIDILKKSSMSKGLKVLHEEMSFIGKQKVKLNLDVPLHVPNFKANLKGEVEFFATDFNMGQFQLQQLDGVLSFHDFSLKFKELEGRFLNQSVKVSGEIINLPNQQTTIDVLINGNYDVIDFTSVLGFNLPAVGRSPWLFSITNKGSENTKFLAQSNLIGIQLNIPEPFSKSKLQGAPFSISCILPCIDSGWDLQYDNKISTNFTLNSKTNDIKFKQLMFANSDTDFGGELDVVDVDKWIEVLANNSVTNKNASIPFKQMSIQVNKLIFMARELADVKLEIINDIKGTEIKIISGEIKGSVKIANDIAKRGIIVELEKLHWQAPDIDKVQESSSKISSSYPPLHIWIGDFIYNGIPLGEASIEVRPTVDGVRVEKFVTSSELLKLNINGVWNRNQGKNGLSKFNIIMTSKDIAKFLASLGFQAPISQAETIIDMQAQWHDFPSQFAIKNISGKMRIEIGDGEVIDAKPGIGRVLGLFSLTNLPRRLILDFRDVFGKGLRFKSMQGDFILKDGDAFTDLFEIDTSSAKITISGKTGLANQDYDQMVIVEPRVGRVLPTIGAIAGGAVGAAAGFLVQGMFHKGLKGVGKIIYKVTGSWDKPEIKLIETYEK